MTAGCAFCAIAADEAPATILADGPHVVVFPRGPRDRLHEDWPWHRALYDGLRR